MIERKCSCRREEVDFLSEQVYNLFSQTGYRDENTVVCDDVGAGNRREREEKAIHEENHRRAMLEDSETGELFSKRSSWCGQGCQLLLFLDRCCRIVDRIALPVAGGFDVLQNDFLRAEDRRTHRCGVLARHR